MLLVGALFPSWQDFQPFLITGLALGGVYALSGVGMVVLYRATGVLYLAFGAVGAFGALVAWQLINQSGWSIWPAYAVAVAVLGDADARLRDGVRPRPRQARAGGQGDGHARPDARCCWG